MIETVKFMPGSSVTPKGTFLVGVHSPPSFSVVNLREQDLTGILGHTTDGTAVDSSINFPKDNIQVTDAKTIYEIPNAFPFRGTTFIDSDWASARAEDPATIGLPPAEQCSLLAATRKYVEAETYGSFLADLPKPVLYALAANSTDPDELTAMAQSCCRMEFDQNNNPTGLVFLEHEDGSRRADIDDFELFETIANNPYLPDSYKDVMVLRPGVQGTSPIVGEYSNGNAHVFEYLRSNSYIPWGHYASNMANDAVRYRTADLTLEDIRGLRHLYYQRVYASLAEKLEISLPAHGRTLTIDELENIRTMLLQQVDENTEQLATLWGWNYGYDISASGYRLHASHQMIHQQYAMVRQAVPTDDPGLFIPSYSCGDLVADTILRYREITGSDFFNDYQTAIRNNIRTDGKNGAKNLVVWEDENVLLFVPKAQVSQWEMQLMIIADTFSGPVGNIVEADKETRNSIDRGILTAQKIYAAMGARMITSIEFPKRIGVQNGQRLLYSFLPKLPWSMGAFSEAQLRFISGHYPEDFAACCRQHLQITPIT